jgi:hypothetical protein
LQKSTEKIPEKITPTLDKLYDEFRTFGARLNAKIEQLQASVAHQSEEDEDQLNSMKNLKECVQAAAEVASTASTTLQAETSDRLSVKYGSDFGDIFVKDANVPMLRWMASHTVHEFEEMGSPFPDPSEASTGDATTEYQSDSDSDIENDLMRSLFNEGKTRKEENDVHGAIKHFRNCLTRFSSNGSYVSLTSLQSVSTCGVSKAELLDHLTDSYCLLASWSKAKITMVEKLSITERQVGKKDELFLWDTIRLAEIMLNNKEYVESHLQARRSLRGFKKLGEPGYKGYEKCLALLIQLCKEEGKEDEEDAYAALLGNHKRKTRPSHQSSDRPSQLRAPRTSSHQDDRDAAGSSTPEATKEFREEGQVNPTTKSVENDGANPPFDSPSKSTENPRGVKKDIAKADVKPEPTTNVSELGKYRAHSLENALGISIGPHQEAREEMLQELSKRDLHGVGGGSPLSQQALYPTALETHQETNSRPWLHGALNGKIGTTEMMTSYMALTAESDRSVLKSDMISAVPTKDDSSTLHLLNKTAAEPGAIAVAEVESPSADNTSHHSQSPHHSHVKLLEEQPTPKPQPIWMSIDDTETTYTTPLPVIETQNMLFRVAAEEFGEKQNTKSKRRDVELLRMYCERFHGQSPYVQTIHHPGDGWACMVKINNTHGCRVSGLMFSDQARDAAISRACEMFISAADEEHLLNNTKLRDPSSDKEVIHPEIDRLEYKEAIPEFHDIGNTAVVASTSVPHITISSDDNSHTHQEHTVESVLRRSASDSEVGRRHTGTQDLDQIYAVNKTVAAIDAELRKLKEHHHSAARLPGAPSGDLESEWIPGDDQSTTQTPQWSNNCPYCDEDLTRVRAHEAYQHVYHTCAQIPKPTHHQEIDDTPSCPICDASLSGLSEEAVLIHVNGCIDAAPASVEPMHETEQVQRESNLSASRMSWDTFLNRYDSPEGTWACSVCKSDRLQPMQESCGSCFKQRADADPSSLNDFRRQPFDSYQTFLTSLNLDLLTTSDGKVVRRKVLLLGDTLCGKTYLASAWSHNAAPATNAPMVNNFMKVIKIEGGREVELVIWDSTCMDGYERLRRLSYGDVHVILVCFDISEPDSLDNVEHMVCPFLYITDTK